VKVDSSLPLTSKGTRVYMKKMAASTTLFFVFECVCQNLLTLEDRACQKDQPGICGAFRWDGDGGLIRACCCCCCCCCGKSGVTGVLLLFCTELQQTLVEPGHGVEHKLVDVEDPAPVYVVLHAQCNTWEDRWFLTHTQTCQV
jgi:hypothetical protein